MSKRWLEFGVSIPCDHSSDTYDGCPLCRIAELEAENEGMREYHEMNASDAMKFLENRIKELEAENANQKHNTAEEPGDLCFNEVTGLHAESDLYRIEELQAEDKQLNEQIDELRDLLELWYLHWTEGMPLDEVQDLCTKTLEKLG